MATKVTSMADSSGNPTPPYPTPTTEAATEGDLMSSPNLTAVNNLLDPIQENLNDAADDALFPSPPVTTPLAYSPAPSVIVRQFQRSRGLSAIGERLARITVDRCFHFENKDKDMDSARSDCMSIEEGPESTNDIDKPLLSPCGSIPIALGSPVTNPRLQEYLAHGPNAAKNGGEKSTEGDDSKDGVSEKSNWAEEVMGDLERAILRLEQLADDEESSKGLSAKEHFLERLNKVVGSEDRKYPVKNVGLAE
ncbi:hypothetical protein K491DRAFT_757827 [Lophiostoma macrostomum CBS 122681]|uniref:Uncharacterized protein n=1 Tax=Lophiostoma macrostomum CBS 122681 TaxID=1314788 RepID=A0A6A6T7Q8_9PLEO|nr:hypothetical protein K491DRAFT_757827 [Lophiostoma macrostomum CBS 122681]